MTRRSAHVSLTPRDREIFQALFTTPLTAEQMLAFSGTFNEPFQSIRRVQERLVQLTRAGLLKRWRYATESGGAAPHYYKLSREGFKVLHGPDEKPPRKRFFSPISLSLQAHTQVLAALWVHLHRSAHQSGLTIENVYPENCLKLATSIGPLVPDGTFDVILPDGRRFHFFLEMDCSTESLRSRSFDGWERRIRRYEMLRQQSAEPFRVLVVTSVPGKRLDGIMKCIAEQQRRSDRSLFLGISLPDVLQCPDAFVEHIFSDHRGRSSSLTLPPTSDKKAMQMALSSLLPWKALRQEPQAERGAWSTGRPSPSPRPPVTRRNAVPRGEAAAPHWFGPSQ